MNFLENPTIIWLALAAFVIIAIKGQMDYSAQMAQSTAANTTPTGAKSTVKS